MAPEVIKGEEHTFALDFWSLGVITYEFLTGKLPFNDDTPEKVFKKILNRDIVFPQIGYEEGEISPNAFDFINKLLSIYPKQRLGYQSIEEIKRHPFFDGVDWDHIMEVEPPFKPQGRDYDTSYFPNATADDDDLEIIMKDQPRIAESSIDQKEFKNFESMNLNALSVINKKEALKAILMAKRSQKKAQ